jgi:hypothetical protein
MGRCPALLNTTAFSTDRGEYLKNGPASLTAISIGSSRGDHSSLGHGDSALNS